MTEILKSEKKDLKNTDLIFNVANPEYLKISELQNIPITSLMINPIDTTSLHNLNDSTLFSSMGITAQSILESHKDIFFSPLTKNSAYSFLNDLVTTGVDPKSLYITTPSNYELSSITTLANTEVLKNTDYWSDVMKNAPITPSISTLEVFKDPRDARIDKIHEELAEITKQLKEIKEQTQKPKKRIKKSRVNQAKITNIETKLTQLTEDVAKLSIYKADLKHLHRRNNDESSDITTNDVSQSLEKENEDE